MGNIKKPLEESEIKVSMDDFDKALVEVKPHLGLQVEALDAFMQHSITDYGDRFTKVQDTLAKLAEQVGNAGKEGGGERGAACFLCKLYRTLCVLCCVVYARTWRVARWLVCTLCCSAVHRCTRE